MHIGLHASERSLCRCRDLGIREFAHISEYDCGALVSRKMPEFFAPPLLICGVESTSFGLVACIGSFFNQQLALSWTTTLAASITAQSRTPPKRIRLHANSALRIH